MEQPHERAAAGISVGIDQIRELMTTLKRTPHPRKDQTVAIDLAARMTIEATLARAREMFLPFGSQVAVVRATEQGQQYK